MAVVKVAYAHSKPEPWETGCSATPSFLLDPYAFDMSYQYMAQSTNQLGIDVTQPGYIPGFKLSSQDPSALDGDGKKSEGSYEEKKSGVSLRRSFSTPNAAQMQQSTQDAQSHAGTTGEKKRNKLGYHRTSIPCSKSRQPFPEARWLTVSAGKGHCRRRKIRWIASADGQNRCVNCIRLKKDCSFYPVDQQPGGESRSRAPARQSASVTSTNSSPAVAAGSPGEIASHHGHAPVPGIGPGIKAHAAGADELYPPEVKGSGHTTAEARGPGIS